MKLDDPYQVKGAYHWKWYADENSQYHKHVNYVRVLIGNRHKDILDVGAGDGLITSLIEAKGIDINPIAVSYAQEKGVDVSVGSAYSLPYADETYDLVFMGDVIEHLMDSISAVLEARRVLRKKGILFITTPLIGKEGKVHNRLHYKEYDVKRLTGELDWCGLVMEFFDVRDGKIYMISKKLL